LLAVALLAGCASTEQPRGPYTATVSVTEQKMEVAKNGVRVGVYPVSTSKFGLGSQNGSYRTPTGQFVICRKIGDGVPVGGKFRSRRFTGEVVDLHRDYSRDSILTRILWLSGIDSHNRNAAARGIYIHGTNQEKLVGQPASYGCVRMRNRDVVEVFNELPVGTLVVINNERLPNYPTAAEAEAIARREQQGSSAQDAERELAYMDSSGPYSRARF
jgi:lipoprotein-anchoring transpeptidase ErfK/SrfK